MSIERHRVVVTIAGGAGAGTGYTPAIIPGGRVVAIRYTKPGAGGFDNGVDFDVTAEDSGLVIWDEDNVNASADRYPRAAVQTTLGAASLYAAGGTAVVDLAGIPVAAERVKIAVGSGGSNGNYGTFDVYVES